MKVKFDEEFFAVLVHSCEVTGAVETLLFGDVEMAKCFCNVRWDLPEDEWDPYLVDADHASVLKLNGEGVRYCGWRLELDEGESFHIPSCNVDIERWAKFDPSIETDVAARRFNALLGGRREWR